MSTSTETAPVRQKLRYENPATGQPLPELECHTLEEVDQTLENLRQAALAYNNTSIRERRQLVRRFRKALARNVDRLVATICEETGKQRPDAMIEIFAALEIMHTAEKLAPATLRRSYRSSGALIHKRGYVDYRPHGVVAIVAPWNYPLSLTVSPAAEALMAGNTVALKPSEYTSHTAVLVKEIFDEATGRPEILAVLLGARDIGERLISSPLTDMVCFIGSTRVGKVIAKTCAGLLKPVVLELGGKDPMIVLEDANLKRAAKSAVWGGFSNAGQTCISVERIYVIDSVYEKFLQLVREETKALTTGNASGSPVGPVTLTALYDKINSHRKDAESKGATVEMFGEPDGQHMPPFLVTDADHTMDIIQDETFGPELTIMPVSSDEEAIQLSNDSRFGLSAYIFTGSARRGRRIARRLASGMVVINDVIVQYGFANLPFGGFGESGLGKLHGREGLLSFSRQQAVVESRIGLPMELWWFDLGEKAYGLMRRFIKLWYG
jgi:acyl-CoA reductase-like NAD-dependent aldehyde dehydrogenase